MKAPTNQAIRFLSQLPVFESLPEPELTQLHQLVRHRVVRRQETIYEAGDPAEYVCFLVKGTVKIGSESSEGREVIKYLLHPPGIFGELGLVGESRRQDTAVAMSKEVHLYTLSTRQFRLLMQTNQQLALNVLNLIGDRLRETESRLEAMVFKDARARIIDFLKDTARTRGRRIGFELLIKHSLTQQDIANFTGTSRQTVTSVLNELRKDNLIYFNRRSILIRDVAKLV